MKSKYPKLILGLASLVFGLATTAMPTPVRAQILVPPPDQDAFYVPPAGYQSLANGTVLKDRPINAQFLLPFISTDVIGALGSLANKFLPFFDQLKNLQIDAYQVLYKSQDQNDQPMASVATILVPRGPWTGKGSRPLISYQLAIDSAATRCQPSYTIRTGLLGGSLPVSQFEISLSLPALLQGYALVYSDNEGPQANFAVGKVAAHAVLDGVRASVSYAPAGFSAQTPIALWGYSGGGGATSWAAAEKKTYAPELNIVGAAIGADGFADLARLYYNINGKLTGGFAALAIASYRRAYPEVKLGDYFTAEGNQLLDQAGDLCSIGAIARFALEKPLEEYTIAPSVPLPESAIGRPLITANSLIYNPHAPDMPVLSYHDQFDDLVPVEGANQEARNFCAAGTQVEVMRTWTPVPYVALVHVTGEIIGALPALNYLTQRFNGKSPRNDCPAAAVWSSKLPYYPLITE